MKLTEYTTQSKQDKYKAQAVYVDTFRPPQTAYEHAKILKDIWKKFSLDGGQATTLIIDCQGGHGKPIVESLMKKTTDGSRPLACLDGYHSELEQPNALRVVYPIKAGTKGTADPDGDMVEYAQIEFEQGNVELLTPRVLDGIEQYKLQHNIKDNSVDGKIVVPYKRTDELCGQIKNLQKVVSGTTVKEVRKSARTPRDIFSALKYALRMKWRLEQKLQVENNKSQSSWATEIEKFGSVGQVSTAIPHTSGDRSRLISLRTRTTRR